MAVGGGILTPACLVLRERHRPRERKASNERDEDLLHFYVNFPSFSPLCLCFFLRSKSSSLLHRFSENFLLST